MSPSDNRCSSRATRLYQAVNRDWWLLPSQTNRRPPDWPIGRTDWSQWSDEQPSTATHQSRKIRDWSHFPRPEWDLRFYYEPRKFTVSGNRARSLHCQSWNALWNKEKANTCRWCRTGMKWNVLYLLSRNEYEYIYNESTQILWIMAQKVSLISGECTTVQCIVLECIK